LEELFAVDAEFLKFVFDENESIAINIPLPVRSFDIDTKDIFIIPEYSNKFGIREYLVGVYNDKVSKELIFLIDMIKAIEISLKNHQAC